MNGLHPDAATAAEIGTVRIVGTGLLGSSIGLALRSLGGTVLLADTSPNALALARDVGAGVADDGSTPVDLVVVATPPDVTAATVAAELASSTATVTDVASVKSGVAAALAAAGADLSRYVGGHPMAGRERSGPIAARADLFLGRPWVVCGTPSTEPGRVRQVARMAQSLGATPIAMDPAEHDRSVALVSHVPQIVSSLVAARLRDAPGGAVGLAGQGLRDLTRIAGSDPGLWVQILAANAGPVLAELEALGKDFDLVLAALRTLAVGEETGGRGALARTIADGNEGRERIPGKHGAAPTVYSSLTVLIPDKPGQLGRLFADVGAAGINIEEFSLEHSPGQPVGLAEVSVLPTVRADLEETLTAAGWHVVA